MPHAQTTLIITRDGPIDIQRIMEENMTTISVEGRTQPPCHVVFTFTFFFYCLFRECSVGPNGTPKEQNYVHGYPKPVSPVLRATHLHYSNEASGESFLYCYTITCWLSWYISVASLIKVAIKLLLFSFQHLKVTCSFLYKVLLQKAV